MNPTAWAVLDPSRRRAGITSRLGFALVLHVRLLLAFPFLAAPRAHAGPEPGYLADIKPLLRQRCYSCHGALRQKAGLRLDTADAIRRGSTLRPATTPSHGANPDHHPLLERVTHPDKDERMPPDGDPLTPAQVALLREWVRAGMPFVGAELPEPDPRDHWAFRNPVRPPVPVPVPNPGQDAVNPIDAFLASEWNARGLVPNPQASPANLLRRLYIDLVGFPPSRDELLAFLADPSEAAYERIVDTLLQSPQHGERWARHWMDVWRYADWFGRRHVPDVWNSAPQIYRWRDWIVASLNKDKGYDRMGMEMLAADELDPANHEDAVATGYLVRNWYALNPNHWMRENVEHVAKAFLGLTLHCAHCHDHKYDPISQREYFQFRAFFEPLGLRQDRWPGEPDPGPFQRYEYSALRRVVKDGAISVLDENPAAPTRFYTGGDERNVLSNAPPVLPGVPAVLAPQPLSIQPVQIGRAHV